MSADTGTGIELEDIERLFSPFEQTKIGRVFTEGTGLILSICQKFVDLMGGELKVQSTVWRSQLYQAAARVDNQEILQLLSDIPEEYESLAQGIENLVEHFRCDKIIDLTKSVN